jgi:hypothetical protein
MDAPAGHPSPVDFSIKTRCSKLENSIKDELAEKKPLLIAKILRLNTFCNRMRQRFYGVMKVYIAKCLEERRKGENCDRDLIWGPPQYRVGGHICQRKIAFDSGKLFERCNIFPMLNRISNPFYEVTEGVCIFPFLELAIQEVIRDEPETLYIAEETERIAPRCGRSSLIQHIGEQYCVSTHHMMYGDLKRFQSKLLVYIATRYILILLPSD